MQEILYWVNNIWPIAATITPFMIATGLLWLRTKFATVADVTRLAELIRDVENASARHDLEIQQLREADDSEPTRQAIITSHQSLAERMSRMEANIEQQQRLLGQQSEAIDRQLRTLNTYVHTLVESGLRGERS